MSRFYVTASLLALALLLMSPALTAQAGRTITPPPSVSLDPGQEKAKPQALALPYAFKSESLEWAYGVAGGGTGYYQEQLGLFGAVMGSSNDSKGIYMVSWNYQLPYFSRLFMDANISWGNYNAQRIYGATGPVPGGQRAGSNDSDKGNFLQSEGEDNWFELTFRYVLPMGNAKDLPIGRQVLKHGLLIAGANGGDEWNPLTSGVSLVEVRPFVRQRTMDDLAGEGRHETGALMLGLTYNNTDFPTNPSKGSYQRVALTRDFGLLEDSDPWTSIEAEVGKFFDLGAGRYTRQNVLALNAWTSHCMTWEQDPDGTISNAPPHLSGGPPGRLLAHARLCHGPFQRPLGHLLRGRVAGDTQVAALARDKLVEMGQDRLVAGGGLWRGRPGGRQLVSG